MNFISLASVSLRPTLGRRQSCNFALIKNMLCLPWFSYHALLSRAHPQWCNVFVFPRYLQLRYLKVREHLIADKTINNVLFGKYASVFTTPYSPFMKESPGQSAEQFSISIRRIFTIPAGFALLFVGMLQLQYAVRFVHRWSETMPAALSNTAWPADSIFFRLFSCYFTYYSCFFTAFTPFEVSSFHATYDINKFPIGSSR